MSQVEKISVAVTPEMAAMMRQAVATGEYASASEVMREALREWRQRRAERDQAIAELGRLWDEGLASGGARPAVEVFERIRGNIAPHRKRA